MQSLGSQVTPFPGQAFLFLPFGSTTPRLGHVGPPCQGPCLSWPLTEGCLLLRFLSPPPEPGLARVLSAIWVGHPGARWEPMWALVPLTPPGLLLDSPSATHGVGEGALGFQTS